MSQLFKAKDTVLYSGLQTFFTTKISHMLVNFLMSFFFLNHQKNIHLKLFVLLLMFPCFYMALNDTFYCFIIQKLQQYLGLLSQHSLKHTNIKSSIPKNEYSGRRLINPPRENAVWIFYRLDFLPAGFIIRNRTSAAYYANLVCC